MTVGLYPGGPLRPTRARLAYTRPAMRLALLVSLLVASVATWPMVIAPTSAVVGHPGNDVWNHVWGYYWVAQEVAQGHFPTRTTLMHFPDDSRLFFIDTFGAFLTLPIQWISGPVVAINAVVFICYTASALAAWLLARHVLGELRGAGEETDRLALFAAPAYALTPHLLAQTYNGITETLFAFGLPLAVLAVLRLYDRPGVRNALMAAGAGALCTTANPYYGLFAALGSGVLLLVYAFVRRERIGWRALPTALILTGLLAVILVSPMVYVFSSSLDGADAIVQRDREFVWKSLINHNITDLVSLFRPGKVYSPDLKKDHGEDLLIVTYLGWALLATAAFGFWKLRRWRDRVPWMVWILVSFLLMLGPYLYIGGSYVTYDDRRIPLPFLVLFDAIPAFERISHPFRFVVPVQLGLAMFACVGLAHLPRWARWIPPVAMLVEVLQLSPAPWPLPRSDITMPAYNEKLGADPVAGAVVDLPATVPNLERAVYLYYQTVHGRPIPFSLNEPMPPMVSRSHLLRAVLTAEAGRIDSLPPQLGDLDLVVAGRALARLGVRYIVVHERLYLPERLEQVLGLLRTGLGPETENTGQGEIIWRLEPPAAAAAAATTGGNG